MRLTWADGVLAVGQRPERLQSYPDLGMDELIRFFTLTHGRTWRFVDPGPWARASGPAGPGRVARARCRGTWLAGA
jgi:hypothetical protein